METPGGRSAPPAGGAAARGATGDAVPRSGNPHHPERWHRSGGGGAFRAGIFGANDGLVSNFSLVMGVTGAGSDERIILLAGIAGLLAGAFSMAAGEYVSMKAQREVFERQLDIERREIHEEPEAERRELTAIYQRKGVPRVEASRLASVMMSDPQTALDTHAREELGLDPNDLGSPWRAALTSFLLFSVGAAVPVLPYLWTSQPLAFYLSAICSAIALVGVGAAISRMTGRNVLWSGGRMLLIGGVAALVTFVVGRLIGVSIA